MSEVTLSVCMIVKNEEEHLGRCLTSIQPIADEIIVVDTGSTDRTIEIARSYGATVIEHEWQKDFSEARNKSLEKATKDWILILDADEEVREEDGKELKKLLNSNPRGEGIYFRLVNVIGEQEIGDAIVFRAVRNDPTYCFQGKMHEQIIQSVQAKAGANCTLSTAIKIYHYGYDPNKADIGAKTQRNIDLLNSYDETAKDGYYYYALGNEYTRLGDIEKALEVFQKSFDVTPKRGKVVPIYYAYLMSSVMKIYYATGRYQDLVNASRKYQLECADFKELYFMEALAHMACCRYSKAMRALDSYEKTVQLQYTYPVTPFEEQYNLPDIKRQLQDAAIPHTDKLMSVILLIDREDATLQDTIRSINEIAYEVMAVVGPETTIDSQKVRDMGATIMVCNSNERNKQLVLASKKCRGKYILIIERGEAGSPELQRQLVAELTRYTEEAFGLHIQNKEGQVMYQDVRVFKNNRKLSSAKSMERYSMSVPLMNLPLAICKYFE